MMIMKIILLVILNLLAVSAFAENSNEFESITAGFKVTKPNDWIFMTAQENIENIKRTELSDTEFQQKMVKYATAPLVVIAKYQEPYDDLNPSLKVNIKPLGQLKGTDAKQVLNLIIPQFQKAFQDYNLVQPPMDQTVAGLKAAYMRINYSLATPDGRKFPASSELWIIPKDEYFFMIGAGTRQDEKTGKRSEIMEILNSVVIK
jgi:hypothetical protein